MLPTAPAIQSLTPLARETRVRAIAFYLPQFHPIPENDQWWGKGFTEWRNVAKAQPLFQGHDQPHIPADLGFYDLRVAETREAQAELARQHGVYGFCYYHYWFHGRRLLERPFQEVLDSGRPDFPFCLCWANHNWTRGRHVSDADVLMRQDYSFEDDRQHARWLMRAFSDPRYIRIHDRPLFLVYRVGFLPSPERTAAIWRDEARKHGFPDLYLCRVESSWNRPGDPAQIGFDAAVEFQPDWDRLGRPLRRSVFWTALRFLRLSSGIYGRHRVYEYSAVVRRMLRKPPVPYRMFPCVTPSWDNSPRKEKGGWILRNSTPELYRQWLMEVVRRNATGTADENIVFINAWNEWGEGTHLEPDLRHGRAYLEATRRVLQCVESHAPPSSGDGSGS